MASDLPKALIEQRYELLPGRFATIEPFLQQPARGGGIQNFGAVALTNSTVSGNSAGLDGGGGIANEGVLTLTNSTMSGNTASANGGGIRNEPAGTVKLTNTIIAGNPSGGDCSGSVNSLGHNLDSDSTCGLASTGDLSNTDPLLGPLQSNGGLTLTHALPVGSPAFDAGDDSAAQATDQRGVARPQGAASDIGAYELEVLTVTKTEDTSDGVCDADCSLREAIATATPGSIVNVPAGTDTLSLGSQLIIDKNLTLRGAGADSTIIQAATERGAATDRVLSVGHGQVAIISGLTIRYGKTARDGGGIANEGTVALTNVTVNDNTARQGGGIYSPATVTIFSSTISNNAAQEGGGIYNRGILLLVDSTVSGNNVGISVTGRDSTLINSTVSGNGTGVDVGWDSRVYLSYATVTNNGVGVHVASSSGAHNSGRLVFGSSIVAGNGGNCVGTSSSRFSSEGHNLSSDGSCRLSAGGDLPNTNPLLGPLQDNGGPTFTHALLEGSPAIDASDDSVAPTTDQRGVPRPQGPRSDIGAYEAPEDVGAAPVADDRDVTTDEGNTLLFLLTATDVEDCELSFSLVRGPGNGSLSSFTAQICRVDSPNRDWVFVAYTPSPGFFGTDTFTYKATDSGPQDSNTATVTIKVSPESPPVAADDSAQTKPATPVEATLNATDIEDCELAFAIVTGPANGSLSALADSPCSEGSPNSDTATVTYTPNSGFSGVDTFTYKASDSGPRDSNIATIEVFVGPGLAESSWPMFHHDLAHTGRSPYAGPQSPKLKWTYDPPYSPGRSSPVLGADGTIYVGDGQLGQRDGNLYAIKADGTRKWRFNFGDPVYSSAAVAVDGTVYVGAYNGRFHAINADGTLKWEYRTGAPIHDSSPAIGPDGTVYVGSRDAHLYAFRPDGTLRWRHPVGGQIDSSPAVGPDGTIYVGARFVRFVQGVLSAINPDGTTKWRFATSSGVESSPAIAADGTVYVGSDDFNLYAINPDGTLKWSFATGSLVKSSPAIGSDGTIYVGSFDGNLYAINPDGTIKWSFATEGRVQSSPAIDANGTIYVGSDDFNLYAINSDGTLKWSFATGSSVGTSPAIDADGTLYIRSDEGTLYALTGGQAPAASDMQVVTRIETPVIVTLAGTDVDDCELVFSIVDNPGAGSLNALTALTCVAGDPKTDSALVVYTPTTRTVGTDTFTYKTTDSDQRDSNIATVTITVVGTLADFIVDVASGDAPLTVRFTDTSTGDTPTSWRWDFGDGSTSTGQNPTHTYNSAGVFTVSLSAAAEFDTGRIETKRGLIRVTGLVSRIAFVSDRDGNNEVYLMDADGSNQTRLTNDLGNDLYPAWSPDGGKMVFLSGRDGNDEIYVMDADGSTQARLTSNSIQDRSPEWSRDGANITLHSDRDGNWNIYVLKADGTGETRLTDDLATDACPHWSPDGSRIAFESNRSGSYDIYIMNANGSRLTRLTAGPTSDGCPSWSPDGGKLAFQSDLGGNNEIYVMDADGSNRTRLTDNDVFDDGHPSWSPGGGEIAFHSQ